MSDDYTTPKGKEVAHNPRHDASENSNSTSQQPAPNGIPAGPSSNQQERGQVPTQLTTSPALFAQPPAALGEVDKEKDADKDKGSLSTTVTGTRTHTRSSHRKGNKLSDEGAHGALPTSEKVPNSKGQKPSFLSKLVRVLIPCVGPSHRAHDHDVDDAASGLVLGEKDGRLDSEPSANGRTDANHQGGESSMSSTIVSPTPLQSLTIPTPPVDTETVVPPTPTKTLLPHAETEGVTSGAVQPPGSKGEELVHNRTHSRDSADESDATSTFTEDDDIDDINALDELEDEEDRLIMNGGIGIPVGPDGVPRPLLPPLAPQHAGRKCLVLDLDETLLHSSFKSIQHADYVVPVEIEYHWHNVYVIKRPGVDNFLKKMGELYEIVVFTASLSKYADPVLDKLDIHRVVSHRLFRESCYNHKGNYVKDLSQLGRPMTDTIILDNSPASYIFHPNNAVPVSSWFNDPHDTELTDLCPFLADLRTVDDVRTVLDGGL